mmetsp:Transcript_13960/g.39687  ORF Transcript_13960/g.39687 Transcript_13960/m.39687 type:complete len:376 (+) Transcript_13960:49-1176(+)
MADREAKRAARKAELEKQLEDLKPSLREAQAKFEAVRGRDPVDPRDEKKKTPSKGEITIYVKKGLNLLACDLGGTSDPYLVVSVLDANKKVLESIKSPVFKKNLNPEFEFRKYFPVTDDYKGVTIKVEVMDKDMLKDDHMGQHIILLEYLWPEDCKEPRVKDEVLYPKKGGPKAQGVLRMSVSYESEEMRKKVAVFNEEEEVYRKAWLEAYNPKEKLQEERDALEEAIKYPAEDTALIDAVLEDDVDAAKKALDDGADPMARSKHTNTCVIHMAATRGCVDMLILLVDAGADVHALDGKGKSVTFLFKNKSPSYEALKKLEAHPVFKAKMDEDAKIKSELAAEKAQKAKDDRKYKYCLETGLTGYEDDFPHHLFK